jgi:hypothetical protein
VFLVDVCLVQAKAIRDGPGAPPACPPTNRSRNSGITQLLCAVRAVGPAGGSRRQCGSMLANTDMTVLAGLLWGVWIEEACYKFWTEEA